MAKPYVIEFTIRTVIMADDEDSAWVMGRQEFREISRDEDPDIEVCGAVESADDLPQGWDLNCLPYGGDGSTRLEKLIEPKEAP